MQGQRTINTGYTPREWQLKVHRELRRFSVLNVHRRGGKSILCVNQLIHTLLTCQYKNPFGAFIAQNYASAKRIIWQYLKDYTQNFIDVSANESELLLTIPRPWKGDKIRIQLLGSERPDSLRGLYFDMVVFDEFAFSDPTAWNSIIRPALSDRNGSAILISTPNGRNHFHTVYSYAEKEMINGNQSWYAHTLRASESGVIPEQELRLIRESIGEEAYQAEFECSFFAQVKGAYYKDQIELLESKGQIKDYPIDPSLPVVVGIDLGMSDSTAMWFVQQLRDEIRVIDYYENSGKALPDYVKVMREKPYIVDQVILPHDATVRELGTGLSRVETLRSLGLNNIKVLPRQTIQDGINAARLTIPKCWFHRSNTQRGVECLRSYHKEWNEKLQTFDKNPEHDWSSHAADAFRYLSLGLDSYEMRRRFANKDLSVSRYSDSGYDLFGI